MKASEFRNLYESQGPRGTVDKIGQWLREDKLSANDIDLRECFLAVCGESAYAKLGERYSRRGGKEMVKPQLTPLAEQPGEYERIEEGSAWVDDPREAFQLREDGEGVDLSAFSAITGQIAFSMIGKGWNNADFVGDQLFAPYPTQFSGEKIPWLSNVFAQAGLAGDVDIHAGMNYPEGTIGPRYVTTPRVFKKGMILSFSLEFMIFDRTGQAQAAATMENVGKAVRYQKEYMQLRVFMGYNPVGALSTNASGQFAYNLNGVAYAPYLTSGSNYVNAQGSTPLVDYTSVNQALYLRSKILDPDTGRPIVYGPPKDLFVMPFRVMHAKRILTATQTQTIYPGYSAASPAAPGNVKFDSGNPVNWNINLLTSPIAYQILLQATIDPAGNAGALTSTKVNDYWWSGDFKESLKYAEIFPFKTEQAAPGNIRQFEQDLVTRVKCSEMGVPLWYDPRQTQFFYNT